MRSTTAPRAALAAGYRARRARACIHAAFVPQAWPVATRAPHRCSRRAAATEVRRNARGRRRHRRPPRASAAPTDTSSPSTPSSAPTPAYPSTAVRNDNGDLRYTVLRDHPLTGLPLLRRDLARLRSWLLCGGRAEFTAYEPERFARYYAMRPDLVLWRMSRIALPLALWYVRYRWRTRNWRPPPPDDTSDPLNRVGVGSASNRGQWRRGAPVDAVSAAELRRLAVGFGAAGIKVGQGLSNRPDAIGPELMLELQRLQDDVGPFPDRDAMRMLTHELAARPALGGGGGVDGDEAAAAAISALPIELVRRRPVASASLGQVYHARVRATGEHVAVKVQRPMLAVQLPLDVHIVRMLADFAKRRFRLRSDVRAIVDEFGARLFEEIDYVKEGENAERFARLYADTIDQVVVPRVHWRLTTRYVLTLEWIEGTRPSVWTKQQAAHLINVGVQCSLKQLLDQGFFHADPHAGNLLRTHDDGKLAYLDFGCMAELEPRRRYDLIVAIAHLINRDYRMLARDFVSLDFLPPDAELEPIAPALAAAFESAAASGDGAPTARRQVSLTKLNFQELSNNLAAVAYEFPIRIPPYYSLVIRSLTILEGIALARDPNFKIVDTVYPYVARRMVHDQSAELRAAIEELLLDPRTGRIRWPRLMSLLQNSARETAVASSAQGTARNGALAGASSGREGGEDENREEQPAALSDAQVERALSFLFSDEGAFLRDSLLQEIVDTVDDLQLATSERVSWLTRGLLPALGRADREHLDATRRALAQLLPAVVNGGRRGRERGRRQRLASLVFRGGDSNEGGRIEREQQQQQQQQVALLRRVLLGVGRDSRVVLGKLAERGSERFWQSILRAGEDALHRRMRVRRRSQAKLSERPPSRA